jgi:hypothetical protein
MPRQPRTFPLTAVLAAIVVGAITVAGCGSSSPNASASVAPSGAPTQAPPTGDQWIGLSADHIWLAVPDSWAALNLNTMSVTQAMARLKFTGQTAVAMRNAVEQLQAVGGFIVVDRASVATSPNSFATNVNAFCTPSSITPGPGAASQIISSTERSYPQAGAQIISDRQVISTTSLVIVRIEAILQTKAGLTVHQLQFVTLTRRGLLCYTSFSTDRPAEFYPQFVKMAATIQLS